MRRIVKATWKDGEEAVSPVIATILMVAITVVLAGVLVLYMQTYSNTPTDNTNPALLNVEFRDGDPTADTYNGGFWLATVEVMDEKKDFKDLFIIVNDPDGIQLISCVGTASSSDFYQVNSTVMDIKFYVCYGSAGGANYDNNGAAAGGSTPLDNSMKKSEFPTIENAEILIIDNNANSKMDVGDSIYIFRDHDGNQATGPDIEDGSELIVKTNSQNLAKKDLKT